MHLSLSILSGKYTDTARRMTA